MVAADVYVCAARGSGAWGAAWKPDVVLCDKGCEVSPPSDESAAGSLRDR